MVAITHQKQSGSNFRMIVGCAAPNIKSP